ncbi:MAG: DNA polymerase III subunit alpha [Hyphomicrobiaceae bacterium]
MAETKKAPAFVHLRVHSAYSLLEGALTIETLAKLAKADAMPALGLTDTDNLFGALEFSEKLAGYGIQPIIGMSIGVDFADRVIDERAPGKPELQTKRRERLALLAKDEEGYGNLMALTSRAWLENDGTAEPQIPVELLAAHTTGLIALTGGPDGPIDRAIAEGQVPLATSRMTALAKLFGDRLYVELQRHGTAEAKPIELELVTLAYAKGLPLVATNEPYFATAGDFEAHDALICIAEGRYLSEDNRRRLTREHYFKTQAEMAKLFADLPEALASTIEIAKRSAYRPRTRKPILPQFVAGADAGANADGEQDRLEAEEMRRQAEEGLAARLAAHGAAPGVDVEAYKQRLAYEIDVIIRMRYPGYFLIVADFIKWAKAHNIPVGPGRGSGAGSLVAYALTITDLDPMRFGLLFERFLNPERVSMPDFDIDFCQDRRDEVIRYVQGKYGADRVAQIITFGKLQARAVLRDVGRVLHMPYGQVDRLCKLVPNNPANPVTLPEAIAGEPKLREERDADPLVAQLLAMAQKLEGLYRHASTHAAGVVIGDRPLAELVPLYQDPRSALPATQFNMKWVEPAGLVKFDFLGLKTLTVIVRAVELLKRRGIDLDISALPLDDRPSYELLSRGETVGVFQLESTGMRDSLRRLKPDRFEDIIAMVALYRPGPMDNIPTYIARKHGLEKVEDLHPLLTPLLAETYGVIIYQEQVMQIAQVLSGYSLGEADLLRRAMGKKIKEEMAQQKTRFVEGAVKNGVGKSQAEFIFELVDKFAGYGFNKSHAAAYALVAYQTAYLKANFPVEFTAASMTFDMANTDKLGVFVEEARRLKIKVLQPSINASGADFEPEDGAIRYALAALKNVGRGLVESLVAERGRGGPYQSLENFAERLDAGGLNKRTMETLAQSGAFDALEPNRAKVAANADTVLAHAQRTAANRAAGQNDLFGGGGGGAKAGLQLKPARIWPPMETLSKEFEAIGFYLSGHPLDAYESVLGRLGAERYADFEARIGPGAARTGILAGIVTMKRERRSKSGNLFAFVGVTDQTGQFEAVVFSDVLADAGEILDPGQAVLLHVEAEREGEALKMRVQLAQSLDRAAGGVQKGLRLVLTGAPAWPELRQSLKKGAGQIHLTCRLPDTGREVELRLKGRYDVSPALAGSLRAIPGVIAVQEL